MAMWGEKKDGTPFTAADLFPELGRSDEADEEATNAQQIMMMFQVMAANQKAQA